MTTDSPPRLGLVAQLTRFVAIGALSALVDFGVYHLLLSLGLFPIGAKAISFICGTTTAYLLNRRFTFHSAGERRLGDRPGPGHRHQLRDAAHGGLPPGGS